MRRSSLLGRPVLRALRTTFSTTSILLVSLQPPNKVRRDDLPTLDSEALGFFGFPRTADQARLR